MTIRRAKESDISKLIDLLEQVLLVHHKVRPDLFQEKGVKYTETQLAELIADDNRPILSMKTKREKFLDICLPLSSIRQRQKCRKRHFLLMTCVWMKLRVGKRLVSSYISLPCSMPKRLVVTT